MHVAPAALVGICICKCSSMIPCSPHICCVFTAHAALVAHRMGGEDCCHEYIALRSEALMNLHYIDKVKYVLQLLLILFSLCSLPCAAQRFCSAHALALSAHAALIARRLSGVHVHHCF